MKQPKSIILLFIAIITFLSCKKNQESTSPTIENISESVYASAFIKSKNQYQVYSKVTGVIEEINVAEGSTIKKGETIFRIANDASTLGTENAKLAAEYSDLKNDNEKLNELKVTIDLARSKNKLDSVVLMRQKTLWAQQTGSLLDLEQKELAFQNSKTNLAAAIYKYNDLKKSLNLSAKQSKNNLKISKSQQNDFVIKSDIDGKVFSILKEKGELVSPQSPVAIVGESNNFILELQVDEYDISKIKIGQLLILKLDSYKGSTYSATISKINPIMNERSRSFILEAELLGRPEILYPNLTAEANIIIQTKEKAMLIPRSYLVDETYVLNAKKEKIKVVTGLKDYEKIEIISGLKMGESIYKPSK